MNETQGVILDIYRSVKSICDSLRIRHFAIGGTAIGAVRHQGFIPWDDDLDIAMPIEDYRHFIDSAQELLPEHLEVRTFRDVAHNQNVFAKVVDIRTTNIEPIEQGYPDAYKGVYVDIMPMSGVPTGISKAGFVTEIAALGILLYGLPWAFNDRDSFKHRACWVASLPFRPFFDAQKLLEKWERLLMKYPFGEAEYVGYTWWTRVNKLVFPAEWFSDYVELPFEDTTVRIPIGYEDYLTKQFGDYMKLPPEDKRITHNGFIDLQHSYKCYQSGLYRIPDGFFK